MALTFQLEDNLEREKKGRADLDKAKRKVEGDLKMTQETVEDLERVKRDLEDNIRKYVLCHLYVFLSLFFNLFLVNLFYIVHIFLPLDLRLVFVIDSLSLVYFILCQISSYLSYSANRDIGHKTTGKKLIW